MISRNETYALLAGLGFGAALAILYAPQSGKQTREDIRKGIDDTGARLTEAGEYLREHAELLNKEAQAALARSGSQVQDVLNQAGKTVTAALDEANRTFSENLNKASTAIASAAGNFNGD